MMHGRVGKNKGRRTYTYFVKQNIWVLRPSLCCLNDSLATPTPLTKMMNRPFSSFPCPTPDLFHQTFLIEGIGYSKLIRFNLDISLIIKIDNNKIVVVMSIMVVMVLVLVLVLVLVRVRVRVRVL